MLVNKDAYEREILTEWLGQVPLTLKELGAKSAPLNIFCYISAGCYFFALKLHDFFFQALRSI